MEVLILDADVTEGLAELLVFKRRAGGADHHWAMDDENRVVLAYEVRTLDSTIIIDREGRIAYRDNAPTPYEVLKEEVERLL